MDNRAGSGRARKKLNFGQRAKKKGSAAANIRRTVMGMAERKRAYLLSQDQLYAHDAGLVAVVGGYGHPAASVGNNWLATSQGDSKFNRDGDSIYSKYIDYAIHVYALPNRLNQQCRIIIVRGTGNNSTDYNSSSIADWFVADGGVGGSGALLTQPVDTNKYTVLKDVIISPITPANAYGTAPAGTVECHYPIIRGRVNVNKKVTFITNSTYPQKTIDRIQVAIIPYVNAQTGTATTDNVARATIELLHYFVDV